MTSNLNGYAAYIIAPPRRGIKQKTISDKLIAEHENKVSQFLSSKSSDLKAKFIEIGTNQRNRSIWPELERAVNFCLQNKCHLIISEIGNHVNNIAFTKMVSKLFTQKNLSADFRTNIFCLDQTYINCDNFKIIAEHAEQQKKSHGALIKVGLGKTQAKSGNPQAGAVISKVNKPKIDNAILFAIVLQPVIDSYAKDGLSQRKIVERLNDEGFCAPEGGKWVLSQLQKVLERIKYNTKAFALKDSFKLFLTKNMTYTEMSEHLNNNSVAPIKTSNWDEKQVSELHLRIKALEELNDFLKVVNIVSPAIKDYRLEELDPEFFTQLFTENEIGYAATDKTVIG